MVEPPPELPFSPYEKIAESLAAALGDDEAAHRAASKVEWIVTEKIHGANFCFIIDETSTLCAKRKGYLDPEEDFFGHRGVLSRLAGPLRELFLCVKRKDARARIVYVYGELYGGGYPHPDVPAVPYVSPVQTGVWYSPRIEFCAFDIAVLRDSAEGRLYLHQEDALALADEAKVPFVRPLFRGSYEDAFAFPLGFETTLPALLGLPSLGPSNKAEGVVLKPAQNLVVPRRAGVLRPIVKRKIAEFAEDARFHQAEKWTRTEAPSGALDVLRYEVSQLVNENRLHAAISKVGPTRPEDKTRLLAVLSLVREDLDAELASRHGAMLAALGPRDAAELSAYVDGEARALLELYLGAAPP